jgi:hypothetical protein
MRGALPATTFAPLTGLAPSALISLLFLPEIVLPKIDFRVSGLRAARAATTANGPQRPRRADAVRRNPGATAADRVMPRASGSDPKPAEREVG